MLARVGLLLAALSAATAWPIFFYESDDCNHYPVLTLEQPPPPGECFSFGRVDIHGYSGGTKTAVEKVLLYDSIPLCEKDKAHRAYANHTITNSTDLCTGLNFVPRAYVFIEELLGPIPKEASAEESSCNEGFRIQN